MPSKYRVYIAFPTEEKRLRAKQKAKARKKTITQIVLDHFDSLPSK